MHTVFLLIGGCNEETIKSLRVSGCDVKVCTPSLDLSFQDVTFHNPPNTLTGIQLEHEDDDLLFSTLAEVHISVPGTYTFDPDRTVTWTETGEYLEKYHGIHVSSIKIEAAKPVQQKHVESCLPSHWVKPGDWIAVISPVMGSGGLVLFRDIAKRNSSDVIVFAERPDEYAETGAAVFSLTDVKSVVAMVDASTHNIVIIDGFLAMTNLNPRSNTIATLLEMKEHDGLTVFIDIPPTYDGQKITKVWWCDKVITTNRTDQLSVDVELVEFNRFTVDLSRN